MGKDVAPLVGAWIEIRACCSTSSAIVSLPLWERGLKSIIAATAATTAKVAPLVGAWIEMP